MSLCYRQWCWYTHVSHVHTFPHNEALSCDVLCSGYIQKCLCHTEDEWAKISHCPSLYAWWSSMQLTWVRLNWTVKWSSNGLNTPFKLSPIVHLYCYVWWKIHTQLPSLWLEHHCAWRDLMLSVSFSSAKPHADNHHLKWNMTNVFPAQHRGIVDLCQEGIRVEQFFVVLQKKSIHFRLYIKETTLSSNCEILIVPKTCFCVLILCIFFIHFCKWTWLSFSFLVFFLILWIRWYTSSSCCRVCDHSVMVSPATSPWWSLNHHTVLPMEQWLFSHLKLL